MRNYVLNLPEKTLTITKAFENAIAKGDSDAYALYTKFLRDIPGLTVERKTHATPTKYTSKSTGEKFNCNQFKNLKYENMENFMMGLPNGEVYMNEYLFLRNYAAGIQTNGYTLIRRWFVAQFPNFRKNPLHYIHDQPAVVSAAEVAEQYEAEMEAAA